VLEEEGLFRQRTIEFSEIGEAPPCDRNSHGTGFGERMIAMSAKSDLQGTVEREWHPQGHCSLAVPAFTLTV
jgi:hypothetical protein